MKNKIKSNIKITIITSLILCGFPLFAVGERINKVTVQGNRRVEVSTIQNYLGLNVGEDYTEVKQNEAIKSLYSTALFENINIKFHQGNLIVEVLETPFISKVDFRGNSKIRNATIAKELLTKAGESLSKAKIQADVEKIKELYKRSGRFSTIIESTVETQENNRVKIIFNITEGPKTGIKRIYFVGNENYKDNELKSVVLTRESRWFRFLDTNDTYDPDRIEYDKELLKEFYQSVGFADIRIISATAELDPGKEYFTLTFSIDEGEKYNFGNIIVENKLLHVNSQEIEGLINVKAGQVFNMNSLEKIADKISANLANRGYPQVQVYPEVNAKGAEHIVDVKLVIDKADKIFVGKINIEGNLKTEDRVIRRQFKIAEGDAFNRTHIEKGEQALRNLDYFSKLSTKITPGNTRDRYDINIEVEEKSTSSIGLDVGYNTAGGPFGRLSFLERNLVGTGKYLSLGVQVGKKNTNYYAGITEPYFLDKDLSLSANVFKNHSGKSSGWGQIEQNYALDSVGLRTSLGYDIIEDLGHEIEHTIKRDELKAPGGSSSRFITEQLGNTTTSALGHTLTYDKTDSRIIPKNGYIISGTQEYAGIGGNNKYLKHEADAKFFKSFINNNLTLKLAGSVGDIRGTNGKTVKISDRFNLGDYSLRGFSSGGVGPRDKRTEEGLGGQQFYSFSTELTYPLGSREFNLSGAVFCDVGSVWGVTLKKNLNYTQDNFYHDKSPRVSVGVGLIWITQMLGPIRVDFAKAVKKKRYDDTQNFHIKFSTHF